MAQAWLEQLADTYDPPVFLVPTVVLTEVTTGHASDAKLNRFLAAIESDNHPGAFYLPTTPEIAARAGVLRTTAIERRLFHADDISTVDAQVVALAEDRSRRNGVTIMTSDRRHIEDLLDSIAQRPSNIAVEIV